MIEKTEASGRAGLEVWSRTMGWPRARWALWSIAALWLVYVGLVYRTAWISEDAFITLRTCDNALAGYGLRWNVVERVQTYTHPLWMFVLLAAHAVTGEPFFGTLYVSIAISCLAVAIAIFGTRGGTFERALALGMLLLSKSFVEYSTSGLENPLTHLWIACFVALYVRAEESGGLRKLGLIAGLATVTRFDTALLFAPPWVFRALVHRRGEVARALALAAAPLAAWLAFSLFYYGFPWPNTAYAKLAIGEIAGRDRLQEALYYFETTLRTDPITLVSWLAIAVLMIARRDRTRLALLAGSALSLAYVVAIGGDFMAGRFFSAPYFMAVACLASSRALSTMAVRAAAVGLLIALPALGETPPLFTGPDFGKGRQGNNQNVYGIYDSRAEFFPNTSLVHASEVTPADPTHPWTAHAHALRSAAVADPAVRLRVVGAIGLLGYYAGPLVHFVDYWALADPLLARMPAAFGAMGHYTRPIPDGYIATLASGRNELRDPVIADYYDQLALTVRGELLSAERLRAIWLLNTGAFDERLHRASYAESKTVTARMAITNITDHGEVIVYVWNDHNRVEHQLATSSRRGDRYELEWRVPASGEPELLAPESIARHATIKRLSESGMFTFSVAFRSSEEPGDMDIYELQFHYVRKGHRLKLLREPLRAAFPRVPFGEFRFEPISQAIELLEFRAE